MTWNLYSFRFFVVVLNLVISSSSAGLYVSLSTASTSPEKFVRSTESAGLGAAPFFVGVFPERLTRASTCMSCFWGSLKLASRSNLPGSVGASAHVWDGLRLLGGRT